MADQPINTKRLEQMLAVAKDVLKERGPAFAWELRNAVDNLDTLMKTERSSFGRGLRESTSHQTAMRNAAKSLTKALGQHI